MESAEGGLVRPFVGIGYRKSSRPSSRGGWFLNFRTGPVSAGSGSSIVDVLICI